MRLVERLRRTRLHGRVMIALVVVTLVAVTLPGALVFLLQQRSIHTQTHAHLTRIHDELMGLALKGIDRETGKPFHSPERLLYQHLQSHVLGHTEGAVGFVQGHPRFVPQTTDIHPERDHELVAAISEYFTGSSSHIGSVRTSTTAYMYLVVPIEQGERRGALLHVVNMDDATRDLRQSMIFYALAGVCVLAVLVGTTWPVVRRIVRPIEELRAAAESIDEHDLTSRVPVRSEDDLGVLAQAFNTMLDRVEHSVKAQRDLLDDVGHELRTPITVVRGHLEVVDPYDAADVQDVVALSIDELDRMSIMVNDILVLAKSGESDFITPVDTDIADLTESVFAKCQALGQRQWVLDSVANVEMNVDASRLTQAWLQLASNAVKYSDEGSTIHLGSNIDSNIVSLWVADNGVGISSDELPLVRQRFVRGSTAHTHAPGSGLGLSIVDTILRAHGATMTIDSQVGHGTMVTMRLPLSSAADDHEERPV